MNIEILKARLEYLDNAISVQQMLIKQQQDQVNQAFANLNALIGSKSECQHWIKEADKPAEPDAPEAPEEVPPDILEEPPLEKSE